jgi:putative cell wall-binding protein
LFLSLVVAAGVIGASAVPAAAADGPATGPDSSTYLAAQNQAQDAYQAQEAGAHADPGLGDSTASGGLTAQSLQASASVTGSQFNAGDIISNNNFYNGSAMTAASIQTFLNTEVPTCKSGSTCLKSYTQTTTTIAANAMCTQYTGAAGESAATIIYKAGLACGISQKVLLATMQKEQSLVTSTAPTATNYSAAMGYACPDTGLGCDATSAGFFNQVYWAAWQFKRYSNPAGSGGDYDFTWYPVGKSTKILYSPTTSCGSAYVNIWNSATAALYYYTPYQPNAAALSNLYGSGNACSSYGNRNFWTTYNAWFGSPTAGQSPTVGRLSGADRYGTAVAISQSAYQTSAVPVPVVYIATGQNFPDALSAAPAAASQHGPLLLVTGTSVPTEVTTELARLKPAKIVVVGGTSVISAAVYNQLAATPSLNHNASAIARLSGADRFATSRLIATTEFRSGSSTVYLATGENFPDALSAGAVAGHLGAPVLLVDGAESTVDAATLATISTLHATKAVIVGGTSVISTGFQSSLATHLTTVSRVSGADRYGTSAAINAGSAGASHVYLATGFDFPDALAGAAAAGASGSPLYVVEPGCLPTESFDAAFSTTLTSVSLLGGTSALNADVAGLEACQ